MKMEPHRYIAHSYQNDKRRKVRIGNKFLTEDFVSYCKALRAPFTFQYRKNNYVPIVV